MIQGPVLFEERLLFLALSNEDEIWSTFKKSIFGVRKMDNFKGYMVFCKG